jgi:hypothetical protein
VQGLEATTAIARAVGAETQLDRVLELIVKRGRARDQAGRTRRAAGRRRRDAIARTAGARVSVPSTRPLLRAARHAAHPTSA